MKRKKILTLVMAGFMAMSAICVPQVVTENVVYADKVSGGCVINEDGVLTWYKYPGNSGRVEIPSGVTKIADRAFRNCSKLTSVKIPDSVTSIGEDAFCNCSELTSIEIPSSVTHIKGNPFVGTKWLSDKRGENPLVIVNNILIDGKACSGDVKIPDSVTSIGENAFEDCSNLKK